MSVYVDPVFEWGGSETFRWKKSCHMYADTEDELHKLAEKIGLKREWFQAENTALLHYDLTEGKRWQAVRHGAKEHTMKEMAQYMQKQRTKKMAGMLRERNHLFEAMAEEKAEQKKFRQARRWHSM